MAVSIDSVTSRHVEVSSSETIRASGIEVEGRAIARQRGTPVIGRAVDRGAQVHGSRPRVTRRCTRRDPQVVTEGATAQPARPIRRNEHFEPVTPDGRACISVGRTELRDQDTGAERTVFTLCTNVNVEITGPIPTQDTVEVNACDACLVVAEEGRGVIVSAGDIDVRTEVHCRLPTEIIIRVLAVRDPDLRTPLEDRAPTEQQPVPIGSEVWCDIVARAVDVWPQVLGRPPRVVKPGALGNPNVAATKTPWTARGDVKTQPIRRDSRVKIIRPRIDKGAEVDRLGPVGKLAEVTLRTTIVFFFLSDGHLVRDEQKTAERNSHKKNRAHWSCEHVDSP